MAERKEQAHLGGAHQFGSMLRRLDGEMDRIVVEIERLCRVVAELEVAEALVSTTAIGSTIGQHHA